MINAAANMGYKFLFKTLFQFLGYIPRGGIAGCDNSVFEELSYCFYS